MFNFSTAVSSLRANQAGLQVVGNNLANANTPGYHRQELRLFDRAPIEQQGIHIGQGVDVSEVKRAYNEVTETALTRNIAERKGIDMRLSVAREVEALLTPGQGNIQEQVESFFSAVQQLSGHADDPAMRSVVVHSAANLAESINQLDEQLASKMEDIQRTVQEKLNLITERADQIDDLNTRIQSAEAVGTRPNDLIDQRDQLVNELAELIDVRVTPAGGGQNATNASQINVRLADGTLGIDRSNLNLAAAIDDSGKLTVCRFGSAYPVEMNKGEIGGLILAHNEILLKFREQLHDFATDFVKSVDTVHATGVGLNGSFDTLIGQRELGDSTIPLARLDTVAPVTEGAFYVNVTDSAGQRTLHEITIDPETESLQDIANKISAIPNLHGIINDPPGQLSVLADTGYTFDFTGRLPTVIDRTSITGTVVPSISGEFSGSRNDRVTFEFLGSGTIGVTPGLTLRATDDQGRFIADLNVGAGYVPESSLALNNGTTLQLSPNSTANVGDTFSVDRVMSADTSGFLAATGLNTLFTGLPGRDLAVRTDLLSNTDRLASSRTGLPLDGSNAESLLNVRFEATFNNGSATFEEHLATIISSSGVEVQELADSHDNLVTIGEALEQERTSYSGVDPNEEAMRMLQYQRSFQATARYISILDQVLDELVHII